MGRVTKTDLQELQAPEITGEVQSKKDLPLVEEVQVRVDCTYTSPWDQMGWTHKS